MTKILKLTCVWNNLKYCLLNIILLSSVNTNDIISAVIFFYLQSEVKQLALSTQDGGEVRCKTKRPKQIPTLRFPPNSRFPILKSFHCPDMIFFIKLNWFLFKYLLSTSQSALDRNHFIKISFQNGDHLTGPLSATE